MRTAALERRSERGSAAVEFALTLPLALLMALALLQVGLLVKDQLVVQGAARAGARQAAVSSSDDEARRAAVDAAASLRADRMDVVVRREGGAGDPVTVEVTYHSPVVVPFVSWLFPSVVDLAAETTMRQETE